jgi:hypothetical protein
MVAILPAISAPKAITSGGRTYVAGYSAISTDHLALVEYFPAGEGPKKWTRMLSLRLIKKGTTPKQQIEIMTRLAMTKGGRGEHSTSQKLREEVIDFMLPNSQGVEFNVFRYAWHRNGTSVKSVQYAEKVGNIASADEGKAIRVNGWKSALEIPFTELTVAGW